MKFTYKTVLLLALVYITWPVFMVAADSSVPAVWISAAPKVLNPGSGTYLMWGSSNALNCVASGGWSGNKTLSGTELVYPTSSSLFAITCYGSGGSNVGVSSSAWVTVDASLTMPWGYNTAQSYTFVGVLGSYPSYAYIGDTGSSYITGPSYPGPVFGASCAASPGTVKIGQPVYFSAGQYGGTSPYTYSWSGDVYGTAQSLTAAFADIGQKTINIGVADYYGRVARGTCYVNILDQVTAYVPVAKVTPTPKKPAASVVAATNIANAGSKTASVEALTASASDAACRAIGYIKASEVQLAAQADRFPENDILPAGGIGNANSLSAYTASAQYGKISVWAFMFFWYLIPFVFMIFGVIISRALRERAIANTRVK